VLFPVVGGLIGGLAAAVFLGSRLLWASPLPEILAVATAIGLTGALHEDGLADSADGFGAGGGRSRILAIMKDSRIGTYGSLALILAVLVKLSSLVALDPARVAWALVAAHTLARWSSLPLLRWLPYARAAEDGRPGGGTASFADQVGLAHVITATALAVAIVAMALRTRAPIALAVAAAVTASSGLWLRRRLGGMTGDCLGMVNQLTEIAVYLALVAHPLAYDAK
jgi:adenosylcobinamide-GDP ribazoletransferase